MMSVKHDLLIHYDEDRNVLIFHSVPTTATSELRASSFDGVQSETSYFQSMQPDEAEKKIGNIVFSLTDYNAHKKIGIRDYSAEAEITNKLYIQELEQEAKDGDNDAKWRRAARIISLFFVLSRPAVIASRLHFLSNSWSAVVIVKLSRMMGDTDAPTVNARDTAEVDTPASAATSFKVATIPKPPKQAGIKCCFATPCNPSNARVFHCLHRHIG